MDVDRGAEDIDDDVAGHRRVDGAAQSEAGVVVEEREDLDVGAVGQGPVGEVGLPALVRQVRLEPQVGALGSLARFRRDQPFAGQDPPDRRHRWHGPSLALQVGVQGVRAGIQARSRQLLSQSHDPRDHVVVGRVRVGARSGRLPLDRVPAPGPPSGHQFADPDRRDPVLPGDRSMRLAGQDCLDDDPVLRHPQGLTRTWDRG